MIRSSVLFVAAKSTKSRPGPPISASGSGGPGPPYPTTLSAHWRGAALISPRGGGAQPPLEHGYWIPAIVFRREGLGTRKALWSRWGRMGWEGLLPSSAARRPPASRREAWLLGQRICRGRARMAGHATKKSSLFEGAVTVRRRREYVAAYELLLFCFIIRIERAARPGAVTRHVQLSASVT